MYKVIVDSSADMNPDMKKKYPVQHIPFRMFVGDKEYVDNENMDVDGFVRDFTAYHDAPTSACPSPSEFLNALDGADEYYIVTISSHLSGTHNSALVAEKMYQEDGGEAKVVVIDSKSAGSGESLVVIKIHELKQQGLSFEEVCVEIKNFVDNMKTYFVCETFTNFIKNGRIPRWKGLIASKLGVVPIMGSDDGQIIVVEKIRSLKKVYRRLLEIVTSDVRNSDKNMVAISHVSNDERANQITEELGKLGQIKDIFVSKCAGLSSMYADKNGIIITF